MITFYSALFNFQCGQTLKLIKVVPFYDFRLTEAIKGFMKTFVNKDPVSPNRLCQLPLQPEEATTHYGSLVLSSFNLNTVQGENAHGRDTGCHFKTQ